MFSFSKANTYKIELLNKYIPGYIVCISPFPNDDGPSDDVLSFVHDIVVRQRPEMSVCMPFVAAP